MVATVVGEDGLFVEGMHPLLGGFDLPEDRAGGENLLAEGNEKRTPVCRSALVKVREGTDSASLRSGPGPRK